MVQGSKPLLMLQVPGRIVGLAQGQHEPVSSPLPVCQMQVVLTLLVSMVKCCQVFMHHKKLSATKQKE